MGLDISHGAWRGAYSAFNTWREKIAEIAGMPPLMFMEGFYSPDEFMGNPFVIIENLFKDDDTILWRINKIKKHLPIKWCILKHDVLHELLYHSDCDGYINWTVAGKLAKRLKEIIPLLPDEDAGGHIGNWREKTEQFIKGCEKAYKNKEKLTFG